MKLASRGSRPLKPIASWPTSSASRERKQWRSNPRSRALSVWKGGSEESSSSSLSSQASLDLEEQSEIFGVLLDQQEHEDAGYMVTVESYELGLPPFSIDNCNTSRPNRGARAPNNNQDGNEQIMGDNIHVIHHTEWMDDCTVMPRGAEAESSHITTPVSPGKTQNHCDVDLATSPGLSCEEEAWGDPDKAKYSKVLTKDNGRADEWHSNPKVPELSRDSHATAGGDEMRLACSVPESKQHIHSVKTALSTGQLNEENHRRSVVLKNRDRDPHSSYHTNQSFNVLAHKEHNPHSRNRKRNTITPSQKPAIARRSSDLTIGGKSILEVGPQGAKASGKNTRLPLLWDNRVELLRKGVTQSSDDRKNLIRLEGTGQREPLQLEPMKAQQPKRSGMLRAPRAKSAMECVTYNDMFLEINSQAEGPAIYEMFATPVYEKLRASTYQRVAYREMKCAPTRRNLRPKNNTCLNPPEIKPHKSRREKSISTNAKQKEREDKVPRGKSHQVLISDTELESTISVSVLDCHIQTTEAGMIFCEEDKKSNPRVTPEEHERKRALSIIEEVLTNSLEEASSFHCTSKDKSIPKSAEVLIRPLKESFIPQITSYCSLRTHHIVQEADENGLVVEISEEKLAVTARSDELRSVSFTAQPKIDYWTSGDSSRTVTPVFEKLLDAADEGTMTDDLLRCLAEELISLEEGEEIGTPETSDSCKEEIVHASPIKKVITLCLITCNITATEEF